jgi:hypothetical protein
MRGILREWDRLGIYLLLMAYGGYSIAYPIISFERAAPHWAELMLGVEFSLAGILLVAGLKKPSARLVGLLVVAIGLTTISLSVLLVGGTRVLAYAFLFGAFAMQSVYDIRKERQKRRADKLEAVQLAEEVQMLAYEAIRR